MNPGRSIQAHCFMLEYAGMRFLYLCYFTYILSY
ncbi:hypothetical protein S101446_00740 [Komagataeibacter europaeus]|nr:hypothetical protein S101446_00740 [Komagataeibacter europaeus]